MRKVFPDKNLPAKKPALGQLYVGENYWATVGQVRMKIVMAAVEQHLVPRNVEVGHMPIDAHKEDYFTIELVCGKGLE